MSTILYAGSCWLGLPRLDEFRGLLRKAMLSAAVSGEVMMLHPREPWPEWVYTQYLDARSFECSHSGGCVQAER
jgi:hypothetical protein